MNNKIIYLVLAMFLCLTFVMAEDNSANDNDQQNGADASLSVDATVTIDPPVPMLTSETSVSTEVEYTQVNDQKQELIAERQELMRIRAQDRNEAITQRLKTISQELITKQERIAELVKTISARINDRNISAEDKNNLLAVLNNVSENRITNVQQNTEQRVERLTNIQERISTMDSIKEMRQEIRQEFVDAVQDRNELAKAEIRAVKVAIARVLGEAIRQNPEIDFDDLKGLSQEIRMDATQVIVDSNNNLQARRAVRTMIKDKVMEIRNTGDSLEISDGNSTAQVEGTITIDDNGVSIEGKQIRLAPSRIQARIANLEKMQLKLENGLAKYKAQLANTRNLFGILPMTATETVTVDAETGAVIGYDRPWWSFVSSGTDAVSETETIE
ncbi:MAG: hypothetical protein WC821_05430 [archaeon]|jgi:hypothetical protein